MKKETSPTLQKIQKKYFRLVFCIGIVAIGIVAITPLLGEVGMANDKATSFIGKWVGFLGGFHPLLLHLPIGIVIFTLVMEAASIITRGKYKPHTTLALFVASATGVLAAIFGYCLYLTGDFSGELIEEHKRDGIIFTILLITTFLIKYSLDIKFIRKFPKTAYFTALTLTTLTMISAGHHGGEITHGDPMDKAPWKKKPAREKIQTTADDPSLPDPVIYTSIIAPILAEKCNSCHGEKKQKSDLRMDSYAALLKGGEYEICLEPGNTETSTMITFLHLPLDDDLHMPPEGKPQLTEEEINILEWWVKEGAPEFKKLSEVETPDGILKAIESL